MNWYGLEKCHCFLIDLIRKKIHNLYLKYVLSERKGRRKKEPLSSLSVFHEYQTRKLIYIRMHIRHTN